IPTLFVEVLRVATGQQAFAVRVNGAGINGIVVAGVNIPSDAAGNIWIHYSRFDPNRYVSAADILDGRFDPRILSGRLVLVGASAAGLGDVVSSPLGARVPGVEVHAQLLEAVLSKD